MRFTTRTIVRLCLPLTAMLWMVEGAMAQTGSISGRVALPDDVAPIARRPDVRGLGMPRPRGETTRRRSVVYLEVAPRRAFDDTNDVTATIDQRDETFVPHLVAIVAGAQVAFPNSDETYHNVFSLSRERPFDLGRYAAGQTKSVRFDRPGVVRVFCDIHSHMSAYVLVFAHRFFAVTDDDGRYRLDGVPPGTYTVVAWHELFETESKTVRVPADGADVHLDFDLREGRRRR